MFLDKDNRPFPTYRIETPKAVDRLYSEAMRLRPGLTMVYYTGSLAADRWLAENCQEEVRAISQMFRRLASEGHGTLTQKRLGPQRYEYLYTRGAKR